MSQPTRWVVRAGTDTGGGMWLKMYQLGSKMARRWEEKREHAYVFEDRVDAANVATNVGGRVVRLLSPAESRAKARGAGVRDAIARARAALSAAEHFYDGSAYRALKALVDELETDADALWPARPARAPRGTT